MDDVFLLGSLVSEEQLMKNMKAMEDAFKAIEKDIKIFSNTKDPNDKFSEVLSISFIFLK